jgi:hypothetical protein
MLFRRASTSKSRHSGNQSIGGHTTNPLRWTKLETSESEDARDDDKRADSDNEQLLLISIPCNWISDEPKFSFLIQSIHISFVK